MEDDAFPDDERSRTAFRSDILPVLEPLDEAKIDNRDAIWTEDGFRDEAEQSEKPLRLFLVAGAIFLASCVAGIVWLTRPADPVAVSPDVPSQEPVIDDVADPVEEEGVSADFDSTWRDVHRVALNASEGAIIGLLAAESVEARKKFVLRPEENEASLASYGEIHDPIQPADVSITSMVGWEEPDGQRFAFGVKTPTNPQGFALEVRAVGGEYRIHWNQFVQLHLRIFLRFVEEKPRDPQKFYTTVRRKSSQGDDYFDHFEVSGTNPNVWHIVKLEKKARIARLLRAEVPWNDQVSLILELEWEKTVGGENRLGVSRIVAKNWEPDLPD